MGCIGYVNHVWRRGAATGMTKDESQPLDRLWEMVTWTSLAGLGLSLGLHSLETFLSTSQWLAIVIFSSLLYATDGRKSRHNKARVSIAAMVDQLHRPGTGSQQVPDSRTFIKSNHTSLLANLAPSYLDSPLRS
jgi:hypothetical protein